MRTSLVYSKKRSTTQGILAKLYLRKPSKPRPSHKNTLAFLIGNICLHKSLYLKYFKIPKTKSLFSCQYVQLFSIEIKVKSEFICMQATRFMGIRTVETAILEIGSLWRCGVRFTPLPP